MYALLDKRPLLARLLVHDRPNEPLCQRLDVLRCSRRDQTRDDLANVGFIYLQFLCFHFLLPRLPDLRSPTNGFNPLYHRQRGVVHLASERYSSAAPARDALLRTTPPPCLRQYRLEAANELYWCRGESPTPEFRSHD